MDSIIFISDYVHIAYKKNFQSSEGHDMVLNFVYCIDGESVEEITAESRHKFAECSSSYLQAFMQENEPIPLDTMFDPEEAENDREKIIDIIASLVSNCVRVDGLKMLHVDVIVEMNQEREDDVVVESNDVELLRERRMNILVKNVYTCAGKDYVCVICLNEMRMGEKLVCTPCVHQFHEDCLGRWFEKAGNCPLCRLKIGPF